MKCREKQPRRTRRFCDLCGWIEFTAKNAKDAKGSFLYFALFAPSAVSLETAKNAKDAKGSFLHFALFAPSAVFQKGFYPSQGGAR